MSTKIPPLAHMDSLPPFATGTKITNTQGKVYVILDIIQTYVEDENGVPILAYDCAVKEHVAEPKKLDKSLN